MIHPPRWQHQKRALDDEKSILPLINVIFLLLIFFMAAGRITASDPIEIAPPASTNEQRNHDGLAVVYLGDDGRLAYAGDIRSRSDLLSLIASDAPKAVRIAADQGAPADTLIGLVQDLQRAGLEDIVMTTLPERLP